MKCRVFLKYGFLLILGYLSNSYFKNLNVQNCSFLSVSEDLLPMTIIPS